MQEVCRMRGEGGWERVHGEPRGGWVRQLLSPRNVPEGHLSLIFRDSPKVKYLVLFFFYVHAFPSWIKSFECSCSPFCFDNIFSGNNRWLEPWQSGPVPPPQCLLAHKLLTFLASVSFHRGLCMSSVLGFRVWVSLGLNTWSERAERVSFLPYRPIRCRRLLCF